MKRFLKISALVTAIIFTAIIALGVVLMSPAVQTSAARKVLDALEEKFDGTFQFSSLSVRPFDAVVINDFVWLDNAPYYNEEMPWLAKADTVAHAKSISVSFNAIGLLRGKPAIIKDLRIKDGSFFLVNEPNGNNLKRILSKNKKPKEKKPLAIPDIELMKADYVSIDGFRFRMINHRNPKPQRDRAMNWTDLDVCDIHMTVRDVTLKGIITEATVEHLDGREKSGYVINHVSGRARVYNRQTRIENLVMQDLWSDIRLPSFKMSYDRGIPSLNNFIEEVRLQANVSPSRINMESVAYFAPTLHRMDIVAILESANIDGYINDLKVTDFRFHTPDNSVAGEAEGEILGLPSSIAMTTNYDVKKMSFTPEGIDKFIKGWAPGVKFDFGQFAKGERLSFTGKLRGPLNNARITGTISRPGRGSVKTNLHFGHMLEGGDITIGGSVETSNLDAGSLIGTAALGPVTMHGGFKTNIGKKGISVKIDSLRIDHVRALDYDYKDLVAAGTYSEDAFDGTIFCNDPNLSFMFNGLFTLSNKTGNGAYKFMATVTNANLNALNIDKRGRSELSLKTTANFKTLSGGDILGNILISGISLTNDEGRHNLGEISINSYMKDAVNKINLDSRFATARYSGTNFLHGFIADLMALSTGAELPSLYAEKPNTWNGDTYTLDLETQDTRELLDIVAPGVWIADGTKVRIGINKEGILSGRLQSQRLAIKDKYLKDIDLSIDNSLDRLQGELFAEELKISAIKTSGNKLKFIADDDKVGVNYSFDNNTGEKENKGAISIGGEVFREDGKPAIMATLLPSQIFLNSDLWELASEPVTISSKGISIEKLNIGSRDQSLGVSGGWSASRTDTLRVVLDNFDMSNLNPVLVNNLTAGGRATGRAMILSPSAGTPAILANLRVEDAALGEEKLGKITIGSVWDASLEGYKAVCRITADSVRTVDFHGHILPKDKSYAGSLSVNNFNVSCIAPVLESVFSDMGGYLSGDVSIDGVFGEDMHLGSKDLHIDDGLLRIAFTNVPYKVEGSLSLRNDGCIFEDIGVHDRYGADGKVNGGIYWKGFRDIRVDIGLEINRMKVLELEENMNPAFYGDIAATGRASLTGPLDAIVLKADAQTVGDGELHIPMSSSGAMARSDLLVFTEPQPEETDLYEEMLLKNQARQQKVNRFSTVIDVQAHPGVEAFIEVDKATGNILTGHGNGNIVLGVTPADGTLSLGGNYTITGGTYHFAALGIAKRDFTIQDGSNIKFAGDVMDTDLDIRALYRTKTSLATLLADTTSTASRRWVECGINITNKIKSPVIEFTVDVPDIDPTTAARVESALNTEDKLQKQFLSLLVSGGFLPDDASGVVNNSSMIGTTVADLMASQLTNVLQKLNIPIDLGLDYQQTASGADIFEVAVSTQLFNDRISINGTFGNRQSGATSSQDVLGDLEAEIKLTKNGSIRATAFHRTADQYTNYLDNLKRNGIGLSFQTEFNTLSELLHSLFPWLYKKIAINEDAYIDDEDRTIIVIDEDD